MEGNRYAPPGAPLADPESLGVSTLYTPRQVYLASFLGGPLAGAWFFSRNLYFLNAASEARRILIIGLAVTLGLAPLLPFLPKSMPNVVIPLLYSYAFYRYAQRRFSASPNNAVTYFSGWRTWLTVVGISLAWSLPAVLIWIGAFALMTKLLPNTVHL
jgi:hypothetical protein